MASSVEVSGTHTRSKQLAPWGAQVPIHRPTISRATGRMPSMYSGPSTKGCTAHGVYTLDQSTRCQGLVVASLIQGSAPSWWYMCTLNWRQTVLKPLDQNGAIRAQPPKVPADFTVNNWQFHRHGTAADAVVDTSQQR